MTLGKIEATFKTLAALHKVLGVVPAKWETYRAEMIATYGLDGAVLDTFARLGWLQSNNNGVSFHA